jgi:hypothetical protein
VRAARPADTFFLQSADHAQAEAHRGNGRCTFERAVPFADRDVRASHFDTVPARIGHQLRRRIEAHRLRVQERGAKRRRLVTLEPGRDIHEQRERSRMRFRETVFAEAQDLLVDLARERFRQAALRHAVDETLLEFLEAAPAAPRGHRSAKLVRLRPA